jgi:DNA-binding MarR family transcriptional regulator
MVSTLTDHTGYWLRMSSNAVSHGFAQALQSEDVTVAEWCLLRTLYDHDRLSPSALADAMGMTKGAISKLAERLLAKDLVARLDNPDDRRAHSLSLTATGRAKTPRLAALADHNDAAFFSVLSDDEQATLLTLLRALAQRRGLTAPPTV